MASACGGFLSFDERRNQCGIRGASFANYATELVTECRAGYLDHYGRNWTGLDTERSVERLSHETKTGYDTVICLDSTQLPLFFYSMHESYG